MLHQNANKNAFNGAPLYLALANEQYRSAVTLLAKCVPFSWYVHRFF